MLSDNEIEKLLQPIVDRQNTIGSYIIQKIAKRVGEIKNLSPDELRRLEQLLKSGNDLQDIKDKIEEYTELNAQEIDSVLYKIAEDSYEDAKSTFKDIDIPLDAFINNKFIQKLINVFILVAVQKYLSMLNIVFMLGSSKDSERLVPRNVEDTYKFVTSRAIQAARSKAIKYDTAMIMLLRQLADSGARYKLNGEDGVYTQQIDVYLKQWLLNNVRDLTQQVQDEIAKQVGADGKEISAHIFSAPDHEPIQGHQFTNTEFKKLQTEQPFEDINGNQFDAIRRPIGMWNCRHYTRAIIVGVTKPLHTQKELDENIQKNKAGYTDASETHRTLYKCSLEQRRIERLIRQTKREILAGNASENVSLVEYATARLARYENLYKIFSKACKLPVNEDNCKIFR